jgi:hypothetical protein
MNAEKEKACGNCASATRSTARGMEAFVWCDTGHAARRAGFTTVEAVYLNINRPACEGYRRATKPLPDHVPVEETELTPEPDGAEKVEPVTAVSQSSMFEDETILPWDLPSVRFERVESNLPIRDETPRKRPPF